MLLKPVSRATLRAGCKINLYLYITGVRPNGYHELDSLFIPLEKPCDHLHIKPSTKAGFEFICSSESIDPDNNTLVKAYEAFSSRTGLRPGIRLELEKGIPPGSGLGGGSSDAAALLNFLNSLASPPLPEEDLLKLALEVGADAPFFIYNRPSLVSGIGEKITQLAIGPFGLCLLLVCPDVASSTPKTYKAYEALKTENKKKSGEICPQPLTSGQSKYNKCGSRLPYLINDLEEVVFVEHPKLRLIKTALLSQGAAAAAMSGSGSSVYGLFRDENSAARACADMQQKGFKVYRHLI